MLDKLGIQLIRIPLPFRLNHVNCFFAEGEDAYTILDTGLNNDTSRGIWSEFLQGKEVKQILVSHYHPDHLGYAGTLQKETGAKVAITERDFTIGKTMLEDKFINDLYANYRKLGVPFNRGNELIGNMKDFNKNIQPYPNIDHFFVEGEKIKFGYFEYEVIFTPGHSEGLVCFYNKEKKVLLSTDHILPVITPNISYWFIGDKNPLQTYMDSLKKIEKLDIEYVVPSHGKPFYDGNKRIGEILVHHDERLAKTIAAIQKPTTVFDVCIRLFGTELTVHEYRFAIGETLAHLEYLRKIGECEMYMDDGVCYYSV